MKAIILAAGYATRLYPLTENTPKALLEVGNKPVIAHIIKKIEEIKEIDQIIVVSNQTFYQQFSSSITTWRGNSNIVLLNNEIQKNEDRLGAVGDLYFAIERLGINEDILVIAGDNLFEFVMKDLMKFYNERKKSIVAFYEFDNVNDVKEKYGVGVIEGGVLTDFEEKPSEPISSCASTGCYILKKEDLPLIKSLLDEGSVDNPGDLIKWLVEKSEVHAYTFDDVWFDIGSVTSLEQARNHYST